MNPSGMGMGMGQPMGGLGGNQNAGMSEQEQAMVKMVCCYISPSHKSSLTRTLIDDRWYGIMPRQDSHLRYYGIRSRWCFRSLHGQCKFDQALRYPIDTPV